MKHFIATIFFLSISFYVFSQQIPKREFRAVWVATVGNIDWPSAKGLDASIQKKEFIDILDRAKLAGLNAVIVQIRPAADALYESKFENWSRYLSGTQGVPPSPYYDPLEFMVDECHKRCIEFHAWFNPYRALVDATKNIHTASHVTNLHPDWFLNYGGKRYFDPGLPEVRDYFTKIVLDVVKRYDIDAVHFDDYFYPYRIAKVEFPDYKSYAKYGYNFVSKDDWRRDNVNKLIEGLSSKIKKEKPYVKFGISPFGVWRNSSKDPEGSVTNGGQTNYDDLFADVLLWMRKGWIDYVLPQLYWEQGHRAADYNELLRWWGEHTYGRHLYIGHGIYQIGTSKKVCWKSMNEIVTQVQQLRRNKNVQGSAYYSAVAFKKDLCGLNYSFQYEINTKPALLPLMPWMPKTIPPTPIVKTIASNSDLKIIEWKIDKGNIEDFQYAIYRFEKGKQIDISTSQNLVTLVKGNKYIDKIDVGKKYTYVVTALDRMHNEGMMSNEVN